MQRRKFTAAMVTVPWLGAFAPVQAFSLSEADALSGVRVALEKGAASAVSLLGRADGFLGNPKVRIPLPGVLEDAQQMLKVLGQQKRIDELITAMNRAAEAAVPEAKSLLVSAVRNMSVEDARQLVSGGDTSVTDFFAGKTREPLGMRFLPIVTRATEKVKLADKYNALAGKAANFGLLKQEDSNIQVYVTGKALDGLYLMIGEEERKIRDNPAAAGSAILKKVFGALK
jgi:uncharacterized protein DUF4197